MTTSDEAGGLEWPRLLTVLCGHPCCLKSTVARTLTTRYEVFGIFTHQMGRIRAMWGTPFEVQRAARYERMEKVTKVAVDSGITVLLEGTFERRIERAAIRSIARASGVPLLLVYAYASDPEVILRRFRHRRAELSGPDHRADDPEIYFDSLVRFERPSQEEIAAFDGYAEIDSVTKRLTRIEGEGSDLRRVMTVLEGAYAEVEW
jgi:predicted kinase